MVAFIDTIAEDAATGQVAEMYEHDRAGDGYVWNATKVFSHRPDAYHAWRRLVRAVKGNMDERRYELATLAAARRLRSSYCSLAHGKILAEEFMAPAAVRDVVDGHRSDALEPVDVALMDFAAKVAGDATSVTQEDVDELRAHGLSDAEIADVALTAAMRCFFSKTLDALGALPDPAYRKLDPELREALTVGRPIADP